MIKNDLHNMKGKKTEEVELPEEVFGRTVNPEVVYQVVRMQMANRRQNTAHTKERGEVRGGGRKPWRQKGTGRARHGSRRSPLWRGGGITFGPRTERNYKKKINKRTKRSATSMILSGKNESGLIFFVSDLSVKEAKTKEMREFLKNTPCNEKSTLLVLPEMQKDVVLATRNLENVDTIQAKDINPLDLLSYKYLVMPKSSIEVIRENLNSKKDGEK